jgi:hypothetical protein
LGPDVRRRRVRGHYKLCQADPRIQYNKKSGLMHVAQPTCPGAPELCSSETRLYTSRETRRRGPAVSKSSINNIRRQAWSTTYSHLAVINRVELLKSVNSSRLSPRHQRHITRCQNARRENATPRA